MDLPVATLLLPGGSRAVLEASAAATRRGEAAALAVVVDTGGSTYVRPGAVMLFGGSEGPVGWLSGGCLEPEIERHALDCAQAGQLGWLDIDTRDDEALLSGSAPGCRGRLRIALLPLRRLAGWGDLVAHWRDGADTLRLDIHGDGHVHAGAGTQERAWRLSSLGEEGEGAQTWQIAVAPPPSVLVMGAGPESSLLLPILRSLGWLTTLVERRPRWRVAASLADRHVEATPEGATAQLQELRFDAALVMHHHFELDREALATLAPTRVPFVGLLGPIRRREDLFRVLPLDVREALLPRLRSPVGLDLGGRGAEAIALSIAAQLHAYRHSP